MNNPTDENAHKKTLKFIDNVDESKSNEERETEIVTEIIVPEEGRWGWVVVAGSFMCAFLLDGIFLSFGSIYKDMSEDLGIEVSTITLISSVNMALYYITGPVVSAFVNRFGFRKCSMTGSIIVSYSYLCTYFAGGYLVVLLFYGIIPGIGGCFITMASSLVVGFYFERLRGIAMAIAGLGTSFGITVMYRVNTFLVQLAGWRITTLFHAGLIGTIYFIAMVFRPLLSISVTNDIEDTQTVTYLPSLSKVAMKGSPDQMNESKPVTTATEKLFSAVSNVHFPTIADVLEDIEANTENDEAGPSKGSAPKITLLARHPDGAISQRQLKQVQSMMSRKSLVDSEKQMKITINNVEPRKKRHWWTRCCYWEGHVKETRPMYRDDAFYNGTVQNLPAYEKQIRNTRERRQTGLEYQMAVSRAVAISDLEERKGIFTTAVRRVLATMLDPQLLKRNSFFMVCISALSVYLGLLIPYIFLPDRNRNEGIDEAHCNSFVSVIGLSNAVGRLVAGLVASKWNPVRIYSLGCLMAGTGIIISNVSFDVYYQYFCCVMFGFSAAHINSIRSLVLVDLYGLDKLTNATGMILMFQGFGSLISTPLSGAIKNTFGYTASFYVAGAFIVIGGLVVINVKTVAKSEDRKRAKMIVAKRSSVTRKRRKSKSVAQLAPIPETK